MSCKVTLIGAGSVVFAKTLICDLLQFPEMKDIRITLMDIDPLRLKVAETMANKVIAKLGLAAKVEATTDRREAVCGAKYVLCTIQVGGYKPSTVRDFEIPKKYGLKQTIGDTLGIGGIFRGLRTIPVLLDIARDIADVAHPDCMFLNYTNPMAMLCMAIDRAVGIPHVGLCHSVFGTARMLAGHAGLPFEDVSYLVAGVNHMAFFLQFNYRGQDAYPLLFNVLNNPSREFEKVRYEMMRRTGYFVTESSEHQAEYTPYFIHHGQQMIDQFGIPIDEYLRRCETVNATWEDSERDLLGRSADIIVPAQSHEYGSYIIHSMETNTLRTVYGNVPNRGVISNLPDGSNVEVPCQVDATGLRPVRIGQMPQQLAALCQTQINVQELTVEAALTGRRDAVYHAAMLDPHTAATLPLDQIWEMCDELIAVHQADGYLKEFIPVLKNTGRTFSGIGDRLIARMCCNGVYRPEMGRRHDLKAVVENPSGYDREIKLAIVPADGQVLVSGSAEQSVCVSAGSSAEVVFEIENAAEVSTPYRVQLRCESLDVFCQDVLLKPQKTFVSNAAGTITIALNLSGFPAGEVTVERGTKAIEIRARINDSDVQTHQHRPWRKSSVELMFAPDVQTSPRLYYVAPNRAGVPLVLAENTTKVSGIAVEQVITDSYYDLFITVPFEKTGVLPAAKSFLFNFGIQLAALGEAHSGGYTALCEETRIQNADVSKMALLNF